MNSVVWLLMAACIGGILAAPSYPPLPVNPGGIGGLFRGPNQETIIRGPDGSEITSEQIGGAVQTEARLQPIVVPDQIAISSVTVAPPETISVSNNIEVASAAPAVTISESSAPSVPLQADIPIQIEQAAPPTLIATNEEPHIIETELVDAPEVEPNQSSDLKGPSGSISVRGSSSIVSGPASTTISEPVRRIPLVAVPVAAPPVAVPSSVLIPPSPTAIDGFNPNVAQPYNPNLGLPSVQNTRIPLTYNVQQSSPHLYTELIPPPPPNQQQTLGGVPRLETSDASSTQTQTVSSTPIPPQSLPPNAIDLGQTVVTTTQRSNIAPSNGDIDASRINLGSQQSIDPSLFNSQIRSSSTVAPLGKQNIISSTSTPTLSSSIQTPQVTQLNEGLSQPIRPLFTTPNDEAYLRAPSSLGNSNLIFTPNGLTGNVNSQDQAILANQIVSNGATGVQAVQEGSNVPSRSWVNIEDGQILPSTVTPQLNGGQISSVLDTVLVQPTDPRNREVIEFGGKQLENVGNIVPVIHHPVLVAGGLTHLQQIPTSSISQLTSRNDLSANDYGRYGRQTENKN